MNNFVLELTENEMQRLRYLLEEEQERIDALNEGEKHADYLSDIKGIALKVEKELKEV